MLTQLRRNLWNWLPAFLEIALAGSVVAAARRLGLTPAAVSRTLGLLEDALGAPVFNRVGKHLVLNAAGIALRDAVREATRAVDAGLSETTGDPFLRPLRIASLGVLTDLVVPALLELKRATPRWSPSTSTSAPARPTSCSCAAASTPPSTTRRSPPRAWSSSTSVSSAPPSTAAAAIRCSRPAASPAPTS